MILFNNKIVLIVAPHMDDEIIGCSGTIILNREFISKLVVVYLTNDIHRIKENSRVAEILKIDTQYNLRQYRIYRKNSGLKRKTPGK